MKRSSSIPDLAGRLLGLLPDGSSQETVTQVGGITCDTDNLDNRCPGRRGDPVSCPRCPLGVFCSKQYDCKFLSTFDNPKIQQ